MIWFRWQRCLGIYKSSSENPEGKPSFPLCLNTRLLGVSGAQRLSTVLIELKSHISEVTSSNICLLQKCPLGRGWTAACLLLFEHSPHPHPKRPHSQMHQAACFSQSAGIHLEGIERSFFNSHFCCSFMNAIWYCILHCKGCLRSLEEGAWPSPGAVGRISCARFWSWSRLSKAWEKVWGPSGLLRII